MSDITVFRARKIVTMDPNCPEATHVAVQNGHILSVGEADCGDQWGDVTHDDSLADTVLLPGFVEGHAHMMAGAIWQYAYAGFHDRVDPDGNLASGFADLNAVIQGLSDYAKGLPKDQPLVAWGFDPIFLPDERMNKSHLDQISTDRPVAILFSNFHLMCVNSKALELAGYDQGTNVEGVIKGPDDRPNGELQEMAAMFPLIRRLGIDFSNLSLRPDAIQHYAKVAKQCGVTTVTDLFSELTDEALETLLRTTGDDRYHVRLVPAMTAIGGTPTDVAKQALAYKAKSTDKLRLGAVKIMTDGSIQGWTARVKWPGYVGGQPNGLWNIAPDQIKALCREMHKSGVQMHIHVNGDEASEVVIDALAEAMREHAWPTHRHVLQHGQMMGVDQFRRCAELGLCVNLFVNHIWYFGDQHAALTIGEDRARRMDACQSALDAGVTLAIHSDAPVTPMGPLFTAWCAVNRITMSGRTLGEAQKISVQDAIKAITLGAAQTLKMDDEIGSIETGKRADFAVLDANPFDVDPLTLGDIKVLGTVLGGTLNLV